MREIFITIWLVFACSFTAQAGRLQRELELPRKIECVRIETVSNDSLSAIDISGKITDTDDLDIFTINGVRVKIHNKRFRHRVFLKSGDQPLVIRVNDYSVTLVASYEMRMSKSYNEDKLKELIKEYPYDVRLHQAYIEAKDGLSACNTEQVEGLYDGWLSDYGTPELPNVCPVYSVGYAYQRTERWNLARIKYKEALHLDEYFAPAHLGLAKCYYERFKQNDRSAWDEVLKHCQLARFYNYNDAFYLQSDIDGFYNEILTDNRDPAELYADAYLSRAFFHGSSEVLQSRIEDVSNSAAAANRARAYLNLLRPKEAEGPDEWRLDKLSGQDGGEELKGFGKQLAMSKGPEVHELLGDIHSIWGKYYEDVDPTECDSHYGQAMISYYRAKRTYDEQNEQSPDYAELYCDAVIQLCKRRDAIRGKALLRKADKLGNVKTLSKDIDKLSEKAALLREALFCPLSSEDKDEVRAELKMLYGAVSE